MFFDIAQDLRYIQEKVEMAPENIETDAVDKIIYNHVMWVSLGAGFPVPFLDVALVLFIQLRMLRALANHYGVPFSEYRTKSILVALLSGCATEGASKGAFISTILGSVPVVNAFAAFLKFYVPFKLGIVVAGASTYAVGRLFAQNFAMGERLDAESVKFKQFFNDQMKIGYEKVARWVKPAGQTS